MGSQGGAREAGRGVREAGGGGQGVRVFLVSILYPLSKSGPKKKKSGKQARHYIFFPRAPVSGGQTTIPVGSKLPTGIHIVFLTAITFSYRYPQTARKYPVDSRRFRTADGNDYIFPSVFSKPSGFNLADRKGPWCGSGTRPPSTGAMRRGHPCFCGPCTAKRREVRGLGYA